MSNPTTTGAIADALSSMLKGIASEVRIGSRMTNTQTEWERRVPNGSPLVIIGAGNLCRQMFDHFGMGKQIPGHPIECLADNFKGGETHHGFLVRPVENAVSVYKNDRPFYVILIHVGAEDVKQQLIALGVPEDRIIHWWTLWQHFDTLKMPEWADCPAHPDDWLDVWSDAESKIVVTEAYEFFRRYSDRTADFVPKANYSLADNIYFDHTVYKPLNGERYLDCGAYDGDTLEAFFKCYGLRATTAMAVEASPENFAVLTNEWSDCDSVLLVHAALVAEKLWATVDFAGSGVSAKLGDGSVTDVLVPATTIDKLGERFDPTLIKLDLEGSELAALKGGAESIPYWRPVIACCLYHRPSDLWTIPQYLATICAGYKFYCRCYENVGFETVMYAVPEERCI